MNGPTPFGDTCPYLKIAKHYNVDYSVVLAVAHHETYNEWPPGDRKAHINAVNALSDECYADIMTQADRFFELRTALA